MHKTIFTLAALLATLHSQATPADIVVPPYKQGEKLTYKLKWKIFKAGTLTTEVTSLNLETGKAEFKASAKTSPAVDAFYPVRYTIASSFDLKRQASTRFEMIGTEMKESKREFKSQIETFNYGKSTASLDFTLDQNKEGARTNKKKVNQDYKLTTHVQDILSLLYYARAAKLPTNPGGKATFRTVYEGEVWSATFEYQGASKNKVNGTTYDSSIYKLINVNSVSGEVNDKTTLWIANDAARTLVKVESEVQVGKIILKLSEASDGSED